MFAHADGNLANYLWGGQCCRLVDFEDSGVSDRAFEIADGTEHPSARLARALAASAFLSHLGFDDWLTAAVFAPRRLHALYWLRMLLPGNPFHHRNPAGSLDSRATHLVGLLSRPD